MERIGQILLLFVFVLMPTLNDAQPACESATLDLVGDLTISPSCTTFVQAMIPGGDPQIIWQFDGDLGPDSCNVRYNAADGEIVATFTGDGSARGLFATLTDTPYYIDCTFTQSRADIVIFSVRTITSSCRDVIDTLPSTKNTPTGASVQYYCLYTVVPTSGAVDLQITFDEGFLEEGTTVLVKPINPDEDAMVFNGRADKTADTVEVLNTQATYFAFLAHTIPQSAITVSFDATEPDLCGPGLLTDDGDFLIPPECSSNVTVEFDVSVPRLFWLAEGNLGPDSCYLYQGSISARADATITGDGIADGIYQTTGASRYVIVCVLTQTRSDPVIVRTREVSTECREHVPSYPATYTTPEGPSTNYYCAYSAGTSIPLNIALTLDGQLSSGTSVRIKGRTPPVDGIVFKGPTDLGGQTVYVANTDYLLVTYLAPVTPQMPVTFSFNLGVAPPPSKTCSLAGIEIPLYEDDLTTLNATTGDSLYISPRPVENLDDLPSECRSSVEDASFHFNVDACPFLTNEAGSDVIQMTYTIWNQKHLDESVPIQRYVRYAMNFTCEFNASAEISSQRILPQIREDVAALDPVSGEFDISLQLFDNDGFSPVLPPDAMITVPEYLFGKVALDGLPVGEEAFIMDVQSCWATNVQESDGELMYPIISGRCASTSGGEPADTREVLRNYQHSYATFRFQTFTWTNVSDANQAIYVHCDVTVCHNSTGECVDPGCSRRRRSVNPGQYRRLSFGPVRILEPEHCDVGNGMCSDACEMVDGRVECSCYEGRKLTDGGRICEEGGALDDNVSNIFYLLLIGSVLITVGAILYLNRKRTVVHSVL